MQNTETIDYCQLEQARVNSSIMNSLGLSRKDITTELKRRDAAPVSYIAEFSQSVIKINDLEKLPVTGAAWVIIMNKQKHIEESIGIVASNLNLREEISTEIRMNPEEFTVNSSIGEELALICFYSQGGDSIRMAGAVDRIFDYNIKSPSHCPSSYGETLVKAPPSEAYAQLTGNYRVAAINGKVSFLSPNR